MLTKLLAKKLPKDQVATLISSELSRLLAVSEPLAVYLFGSAARDQMTDMSDLDFLAVFTDDADLKLVKKRYYSNRKGATCAVDMIFCSKSDFDRRAEIGGVPMICLQEGKVVYDKRAAF